MLNVSDTDAEDLRGSVDVLKQQQPRLLATIDGLRADFSELQQKHDDLVALTAAQHHREAQWHQDTASKLESLAGRRRLSPPVSRQQRGFSSGACADPDAPTLLVEGVCRCTGGLLVAGRNVTKELDELALHHSAEAVSTVQPTSETSLGRHCISVDAPVVIGNITGVVPIWRILMQ